MEGAIKQVDKQADRNGQVTNPRIIIDASYIRGMKSAGAPLRAIQEQGGRIVVTDTLAYELFTSRSNKWSEAKRKLIECRNAVEVWAHLSEMYQVELKENRPYGDPLHPEKTERLRSELTDNPQYDPNNRDKIIETEQREVPSIPELFRNFAKLNKGSKEEITTKVKDKSPHDKEVVQTCYAAINNIDNIRSMIQVITAAMVYRGMDSSLNTDDVDETWAIWHFSKSLLTIFCDCGRRGEDPFREISKTQEKRLHNIVHDLDYLILLAFADALATRETKGEMSYYRRWMFGNYAKPLLRCYENDEIVFFMRELKQTSKIAIRVSEQLDGYTCALDPRSQVLLKIQNSETLPASVFISRGPKGHFKLFHGSTWKQIAEILTGYSVSELQNFNGIVFVQPRTRETLFEPSVLV